MLREHDCESFYGAVIDLHVFAYVRTRFPAKRPNESFSRLVCTLKRHTLEARKSIKQVPGFVANRNAWWRLSCKSSHAATSIWKMRTPPERPDPTTLNLQAQRCRRKDGRDGTLSFAYDPLRKNKSRHTRRKGSCVGGNGKSPLPRWTTIRAAREQPRLQTRWSSPVSTVDLWV